MKKKMIVIAMVVVGSSLIIYGGVAKSSVGIFGLGFAAAAIIVATCFRRSPRSEREKKNAEAAAIAAISGH
jgi:hypothetical protein